jgi:hypothetical protein
MTDFSGEIVNPSKMLGVSYVIPVHVIIRPQFVIEEERAKNIKRGEYIEMHRNQRRNHVERLAAARQRRIIAKMTKAGEE